LDEEIRDHIERQIRANVALGMSEATARSAALAAFGRVEWHKESVRDTRGVTSVSPRDPSVLVGACLVLLGSAAVASLVPAFRATRVDPASVLRTE
jgi:hypothetical protein